MKGAAAYIRNHYGVPATRGMPVTIDGRPATIVGFHNQYLRIRFDGDKTIHTAHPTWQVQYPAGSKEPTP